MSAIRRRWRSTSRRSDSFGSIGRARSSPPSAESAELFSRPTVIRSIAKYRGGANDQNEAQGGGRRGLRPQGNVRVREERSLRAAGGQRHWLALRRRRPSSGPRSQEPDHRSILEHRSPVFRREVPRQRAATGVERRRGAEGARSPPRGPRLSRYPGPRHPTTPPTTPPPAAA